MTIIHSKNGTIIEIEPYNESFAESIANSLFEGLSVEVIIQQRKDLLTPGQEEVYSVCAISESNVVGVCTGVRKKWFGERHRIEMVQVVVHEKFRGLGLAREMMREIASHFKELGVEIIEISVESENEMALQAYIRIGFKQYGLLKDGLRYEDRYSDEILLAMELSRFVKAD